MLLGAENTENAALREKYSIECQVTDLYPPVFVWQCEADAAVRIENSQMLAGAVRDREIPCEYEVFRGDAHGWGLGTGTGAEGWVERAVKFWREVL